jgi:elongation of very long chain fatty acids protein 4
MSFLPGGDAYFGALLNSLIHVLMYSYYALALLKIPCPWKRFLTQAQLIQFLSVLIYTGFSYFVLFNRISWNQKTCYYVQTFEMVSLFVLFLHFYSKTYARKKKQKKEKELETVC